MPRHTDSPYQDAPRKAKRKHAAKAHPHAAAGKSAGRRRRRGKRKGAAPVREKHTSHPTSRNAQTETRAWLLRQHGPVCAYCGSRFTARQMTLDHVAPRRGQTAYDRRDNLVLACKNCNVAKRDLAPLAFLLGLRSRAANMLRYGAHLSAGLLDLARSLLPFDEVETSGARNTNRVRWDAATESDDDSPYRD